MNKADIATISETKRIMKEFDLQTKKSFGQNFLIDNNITKNIVKNANVDDSTYVLEIGPGIGSLSQELALKAKKLVCVEIDQRLEKVLNSTLAGYDNITLVFDDFLKLDLESFFATHFKDAKKIIVVANLPYYITTAILIKLFEAQNKINISAICAMMQKEVGQRLSANKNTKDYNSLSILTQYYANAKIIMKVSKNVFIPAPRVDSVVVLFELRTPEFVPDNEQLFFTILRVLFKQRRKTILNNLSTYFNDKDKTREVLLQANINEGLRAENLSLEQIVSLSNIINGGD